MKAPLSNLALAAAVLAVASTAPAQWPGVHNGTDFNAVQTVGTALTDFSAGPEAVTAPDGQLSTAARLVIGGSVLLAVRQVNGGTFGDLSDDLVQLVAYDAADLTVEWTSDPLDLGSSADFGSASTPWIDAADDAVYHASGSSVQKLSLTDGSEVWATVIDDSNTTGGLATGFVNASPVVSPAGVLVATYDGFLSSTAQVICLDPATGGVNWYAPVEGRGTAAPLYVDLGGGNEVVIVGESTAGTGRVVALDASDGSEIWDSSTLASGAWTSASTDYWTEMVLDGGFVYANSYSFGGAGSLVRFDPATGALDYSVATFASDAPPVLHGGNVLVLGGPFGDSDLFVGDAITGAGTTIDIGASAFRNYMAATGTGHVYFTQGGRLQVRNASDGALLSQTVDTTYTGPVTVDANGAVYAYRGSQIVKQSGVSSVGDWAELGE